MKRIRIAIGAAIWLGLVAATAWWWFHPPQGIDPPRVARTVWDFARGQRMTRLWQADRPLPVRRGDPVFVLDSEGQFEQVGEVSRVGPDGDGSLVFYAVAPRQLPATAQLRYHETPQSMEWVLKTLLPPEKQAAIAEQLAAAFEAHHEEILAELRPVLGHALEEAWTVVEQELPSALDRHEDELIALGSRYERDLMRRKLVPLVRREIWPIVRRHSEPAANEIGRELWNRASLWRFGWRYAYDVSPLPERRLVEREWRRFLNDEAGPVLEDHADDFISIQQRILADVTANKRVRQVFRQAMVDVARDPEVQRITWQIIREVVVDNPRMREVLDRHWQSPAARRVFQLAARRFEPTVVKIGEQVIGTPQTGITPEFSRVLRNRILGKDRRWLVLDVSSSSEPDSAAEMTRTSVQAPPLRLSRGRPDARNPFVELAVRSEP